MKVKSDSQFGFQLQHLAMLGVDDPYGFLILRTLQQIDGTCGDMYGSDSHIFQQ